MFGFYLFDSHTFSHWVFNGELSFVFILRLSLVS